MLHEEQPKIASFVFPSQSSRIHCHIIPLPLQTCSKTGLSLRAELSCFSHFCLFVFNASCLWNPVSSMKLNIGKYKEKKVLFSIYKSATMPSLPSTTHGIYFTYILLTNNIWTLCSILIFNLKIFVLLSLWSLYVSIVCLELTSNLLNIPCFAIIPVLLCLNFYQFNGQRLPYESRCLEILVVMVTW